MLGRIGWTAVKKLSLADHAVEGQVHVTLFFVSIRASGIACSARGPETGAKRSEELRTKEESKVPHAHVHG